MNSRIYHAAAACALYVLLAALYCVLTGIAIDLPRLVLWSALGIVCYIVLSFIFGFDPYRTRLSLVAAAWMHYVDRWELRLGQATLSMLGCTVLLASWFDRQNVVLAIASSTLAAWTYFAWRLYSGGYRSAPR